MAQKNTKNNNETRAQQVARMAQKGMVPLDHVVSAMKVSEVAMGMGDHHHGGGFGHGGSIYYDAKQSKPILSGVENIGTKDFGYIPYGPGNAMPNHLYKMAQSNPYTAVAIEYNTDVKVGMGPRLMYHGSYYKNGALQTVCLPYAEAGEWIRGRIVDTLQQLNSLKADGAFVLTPATIDYNREVRTMLEEQLSTLRKDYESWKVTNEASQLFIKNSNLDLHYLRCMQDDSYFDIYFPAIVLERGKPRKWQPKIIGIGRIPTMCARMEEMDDKWKINHIYYAEKWRRDATAKLEEKDVVAYPCVMPDHFADDLQQIVDKNQRTIVGSRPTEIVCPSFYPNAGKPYYPVPKWLSLDICMVLDYARTLISDKAIQRKNSTMWGKIAYINLSYFKTLCDDEGLTGDVDKMMARKNELQDQIEEFLKRRENKGKLMVADSFLSADEKNLYKAIELVDVPQETNAKETKDELEEISSIILFTFGIHPSLIGATPGKNPTTGGTQQRELYLLKQIQVSPRQRLYLQFLNNIARFNQWDSHAEFEIQLPVLTTLDRNATGIEITNQQ